MPTNNLWSKIVNISEIMKLLKMGRRSQSDRAVGRVFVSYIDELGFIPDTTCPKSPKSDL